MVLVLSKVCRWIHEFRVERWAAALSEMRTQHLDASCRWFAIHRYRRHSGRRPWFLSTNNAGDEGSNISFFRQKIVRLNDGLMIVPGTMVDNSVQSFEGFCGLARRQKIPCDSGIRQEDSSQKFKTGHAHFRSIIGQNLARDRMDIIYCVKELSAPMSCPSVCSLQRLRKLIGYLKYAKGIAMKLPFPAAGYGKIKQDCDRYCVMETFTDAGWSSKRKPRLWTSRTQRVISLSSCQNELRSIVNGCCDTSWRRFCFWQGIRRGHRPSRRFAIECKQFLAVGSSGCDVGDHCCSCHCWISLGEKDCNKPGSLLEPGCWHGPRCRPDWTTSGYSYNFGFAT